VKRSYFNIIICVHAPAEEKNVEQKDAFYNDLERQYLKVPKHDITMVMEILI
jgi:hypothetical protein